MAETKTKRVRVKPMKVLDETKPAIKKAKRVAKTDGLTGQQRLALVVGGVAMFVLALSVWEVTAALNTLTGMPIVIAALMAVGIDCGMVVCEMAVVVSPETDAGKWGKKYIYTTVALSMLLNGLAATQHAEGWWWLLAAPVGAVMPVLVYMAGRVAGSLWVGK
jgi:hypothetical protein